MLCLMVITITILRFSMFRIHLTACCVTCYELAFTYAAIQYTKKSHFQTRYRRLYHEQ